VLRSEVAAAYAGAVTRRRVRLPHLPLQYRDFASAQRAAAAAGEYDGQLDCWAGRLHPGALVGPAPPSPPRRSAGGRRCPS